MLRLQGFFMVAAEGGQHRQGAATVDPTFPPRSHLPARASSQGAPSSTTRGETPLPPMQWFLKCGFLRNCGNPPKEPQNPCRKKVPLYTIYRIANLKGTHNQWIKGAASPRSLGTTAQNTQRIQQAEEEQRKMGKVGRESLRKFSDAPISEAGCR